MNAVAISIPDGLEMELAPFVNTLLERIHLEKNASLLIVKLERRHSATIIIAVSFVTLPIVAVNVECIEGMENFQLA